jgi:hypothetical protein
MFSTIVQDRGERGRSVRHATGAVATVAPQPASERAAGSDDRWQPIPVPRPTYTMKPAAPRREPVALGDVEASTAVRPAEAPAPAVAPAGPTVDDGEIRTPVAPVQTTGSIDLNAVLAKRRAAGE